MHELDPTAPMVPAQNVTIAAALVDADHDVPSGHLAAAATVPTTEAEERKLVVVSELEDNCSRMRLFVNCQKIAIQTRLAEMEDDTEQQEEPQPRSDSAEVMKLHVEASVTEDQQELTDVVPAAPTTQLYCMQSICRWRDKVVAEVSCHAFWNCINRSAQPE